LLSHQRKRGEKKESGDCSVNCYLRLRLACPLLSACFCWRSYADPRRELSTHLAPQALFIQSSPVPEPLLQAFPFPSTLGEVTLHQLSQAGVFIYSSLGKWAFSPLLWSFPPTATFTSFPTPVAGHVPPLLPSPAGLFIYSSVRDSPPPSSVLRVPCPLCYVFLLLLLIVQFFFFPWVGVSLSRGLC
jgi:hypothetical protein